MNKKDGRVPSYPSFAYETPTRGPFFGTRRLSFDGNSIPDRLKVCPAAFLISFGKKSSWIPKNPGVVNLPSGGGWKMGRGMGVGGDWVFECFFCWMLFFFLFKARIYDFE